MKGIQKRTGRHRPRLAAVRRSPKGLGEPDGRPSARLRSFRRGPKALGPAIDREPKGGPNTRRCSASEGIARRTGAPDRLLDRERFRSFYAALRTAAGGHEGDDRPTAQPRRPVGAKRLAKYASLVEKIDAGEHELAAWMVWHNYHRRATKLSAWYREASGHFGSLVRAQGEGVAQGDTAV